LTKSPTGQKLKSTRLELRSFISQVNLIRVNSLVRVKKPKSIRLSINFFMQLGFSVSRVTEKKSSRILIY
jgi:hypothetical protein